MSLDKKEDRKGFGETRRIIRVLKILVMSLDKKEKMRREFGKRGGDLAIIRLILLTWP